MKKIISHTKVNSMVGMASIVLFLSSPSKTTPIPFSTPSKNTLIPFSTPSKNTLIPFSTPSKTTLIPVLTPSKNTLIPFSRKQRHKGLTPRKKCQPFGVAYRSNYKLLFQELASDFRAVGKCS